MTTLTPEQFAIVIRELGLMLRDGQRDEFWRVVKMFADSCFNLSVKDFPPAIQTEFASLGPNRQKDYASLVAGIHNLAGDVFQVHGIGGINFERENYELLKLVSRASPSPYAVQVPICLVAGVHGDEPDGILAALEFARRFSRTPQLVSNYALTIYPCVNPIGYERMTRENGAGKISTASSSATAGKRRSSCLKPNCARTSSRGSSAATATMNRSACTPTRRVPC